jgi:CDP-4-dehydro-6-deoxyglucose reductase
MKKVLINRYLSLSRAARLVGVKRGTLQKRIQAGEIKTFEGDLSLEELLKAYPQTEYEDNTMIQRTAQLKEAAINKVIPTDHVLPSSEALTARVNKLSAELIEANELATKYIKLVDAVKSKLDNLETPDADIKQLITWLQTSIDQPIEDDVAADLIATDTLLRLMTAHVRILPSGHDFFSEGNSNLLEAGLRSGLSLNYGCSNGNCGQCLAKVVSGEVQKIQHHDYKISDEKKASGHMLMCCNSAVTDVVLEAPEAHGAKEIPQQEITAKVKSVNIVNDNVALIHLKTPRTNRLRFLAGQHVLLGGNDIPAANHSISSCPCDDMNLHFQVPVTSGSEFSAHVFNKLKSGDPVNITGPRGDFILNEDSSRSLVFVAWHTGFAPVRSLIEHAMALDIAETIHLVWIAANKQDRYLDNLCRSWEDALDNFNYIPIDADMTDSTLDKKQLILKQLHIELDDLSDYDFYIAGNQGLLDSCKETLISNGLPPEQLTSDLIEHD